MIVWTVWENVDDYPEVGGGEYLSEIFADKIDAEIYCDERNNDENRQENTTFYIRYWEVQ